MSQTIDNYIDVTASLIQERKAVSPIRVPSTLPTTNGTSGIARVNEKKLEEIYNFEDALAMGMFFNSFFRRADVVKMANLAQMVNVIAPIMTNKQGLFLQTIYFPLVEFTKQNGNQSLEALVCAPTYKVGNRPPLKYLDVSTTYNATGERSTSTC